MSSRKVAAIDIGSNAMRATLSMVCPDEVKFFKNYRWPLRLGADVFKNGKISPERFKMTESAFGELFFKLSKYGIEEVYAVATSAMRDAKNSQKLIDSLYRQTGIKVEIISGALEAQLIKKAVSSSLNLSNKTVLMIDIGGGSTEITLCQNLKTLVSKSFDFGTVRILQSVKAKSFETEVEKFSEQVRKLVNPFLENGKRKKKIDFAIGTGGNLRRIGKLRKLLLNRPTNKVTFNELHCLYMEIKNLSLKERVNKLGMRKDRADIIEFAMAIIEEILFEMEIDSILLPKVGLKEGVVLEHFPRTSQNAHFQLDPP